MWLLLGAVCTLILAFVVRIILARTLEPTEFGVFYLCMNILGILTMATSLGIEPTLTRQVAYNLGIGSKKGVIETIINYTILVLPLTILVVLILVGFSDLIAIKIYQNLSVGPALKTIIIALPLIALNQIIALAYLGDQNPKPSVIFQSFIPSILFLLIVIILTFFSIDATKTAIAYMVAQSAAAIGAICFVRKYLRKDNFSKPTRYGLVNSLKYTLPIYIVVMVEQSINWLDTILLGALSNPYYVGWYQTALPLARLIPLIVMVIYLMYIPGMTSLYASNNREAFKTNFIFLTKWITFIITPFFLFLILFPAPIIQVIFGEQYIGASPTLQVLAFGLYIYTVLGLSGYTLISLGYTKVLLLASIPSLIIDLAALYFLIPVFHSVGAAIATSLSKIILVMGWSLILYYKEHLNPITLNLVKTTSLMLIMPLIIYLLRKLLGIQIYGFEIPTYIGMVLLYILIIILTKSITIEDKLFLIDLKNKLLSRVK